MAKTVTLSGPFPGGIIVNQPATFVATVANTDAAAVTLLSLVVSESTESDATIGQPQIMTPNAPPGVGFPVLAGTTGSAAFPFQVVFTSPNTPGVSPNNPGGAAPGQRAQEADANFTIQATAQTSDGSVFSASLTVPALSAIAPTPQPTGGALQFGIGFDSNLVAVII